jgi:hypothetical protein
MDVFNTLLRTSDSIANTALARSVHGTVDDHDNGRKMFVCDKNNLAAAADEKTLAYAFISTTIRDPKTGTAAATSYIRFTEYVDVSATEAMHAAAENKSQAPENKPKRSCKTCWQTESLCHKPRSPTSPRLKASRSKRCGEPRRH